MSVYSFYIFDRHSMMLSLPAESTTDDICSGLHLLQAMGSATKHSSIRRQCLEQRQHPSNRTTTGQG